MSPAVQAVPAVVRSPAEFEEALALRYAVFCDEQGVPRELERDDEDAWALHLVVRDGVRVVATGRVLRMRPDGRCVALGAPAMDGDSARIGRMAVAREVRGRGIGFLVLRGLEKAAREAGIARAVLHAQLHARGFYEAAGYLPHGPEFDEAGIPHVEMVKDLRPS